MIDPALIGKNQHPRTQECVYLGWDRGSAMADFILSRYPLEVPFDFVVPTVVELPAIKNSVCDWAARVIVSMPNVAKADRK